TSLSGTMLIVPGDAAGSTYASSAAVAPEAAFGPATPEKNTVSTPGMGTSAASRVEELTAVPIVSSTLPARARIVWATSLSRRAPLKLASTSVANPPKAANVAIWRLPTILSQKANMPGTTIAARAPRNAAGTDHVGSQGVDSPLADQRDFRRDSGGSGAALCTGDVGGGPPLALRDGARVHRETPAGSPTPVALLLLDRPLGKRARLESLVGDRFAAFDRQAVGAVLEPRLGSLKRSH